MYKFDVSLSTPSTNKVFCHKQHASARMKRSSSVHYIANVPCIK